VDLLGVADSFFDVIVVIAVALALAPFFGSYIGRVYLNRPAFGDTILLPLERAIYRLVGTSPRHSMSAREYIVALLLLNGMMFLTLFLIFFFQGSLPYNPLNIGDMSWRLAIHSAASYVTNTDFTHYTAETQMSFIGDDVGIQLAAYLSAATGLATVAAMLRGFIRKDGTIGNFYVDIVRTLTRILLPIAFVGALVLVLLGVPETLNAYVTIHPLAGGTQIIPMGPDASFESIILLGTNGGAWYTANAAFPLTNPTAISNDFETWLMMLIDFSFPFAFAAIVRKKGEALPYVGTILFVFFIALGLFTFAQYQANPALNGISFLTNPVGGYPVGQEMRFSLGEQSLFQVVSVYANVGANNMALGSLHPLAQLVLLFGMFTQSTPGGEGTGFATLLINALLAVFIGGLMVGRTPEYLGKKITTAHIKWVALVLLIHPVSILVPFAGTLLGNFVTFPPGDLATNAHSFTVVLYEFTSESANNGSAMGASWYNDATPWFNLAGAAVMLVGRFVPIIAMLMIGGLFSKQEVQPPGPGTLRTRSLTFTVYLTLLLIIVTALLFLPVMALGPLAQLGL
jgi:K+-transporting ATPase ATPase A chain